MGGGSGAVDNMNVTNSSLLATWRYSDMVPQPSRSASRAIDNAPRPSASTNSMAAATMRFAAQPAGAPGRRCVAPQDLQRSGQRLVGRSSPVSLNASADRKRMPYASAYGIRIARYRTESGPPRALAVVVVAFLAYSLPPYFTGGTRVPATFALHYPLLVGHVMFASVAMVTAVAQIWPGLRARRPALHRRVGRVYVCTAIPAAVCAMVIGAATRSVRSWPSAMSSSRRCGCGSRSTVTSPHGNGGSRSIGGHMIRSATLALSIITNRIWTPVLVITFQPLQDSVFGGNEEHFVWLVAGVGAWLGWTIPFLHGAVVAEPQDRNAAVVNFSASQYAAGVISGRSSTTRRSDTGTRLRWRRNSTARSSWTFGIPSRTGARTPRRRHPRMRPTSCIWCGTTPASRHGTASAGWWRCRP